jgi:hypothetical protein
MKNSKMDYMGIKCPNHTQEPHQMPIIITKRPKDKLHEKMLFHELTVNLNILKKVEDRFYETLFSSTMEYDEAYEKFKEIWLRKISSMKLRYSAPNKRYFEKNYKPVEKI